MEATDRTSQVLKEHFDRHRSSLSRSELAVAEHLVAMPIDILIFRSAEEIAAETGTSDATVIRAAKRLGFSGLPELKRVCSRVMAKTIPTTDRLEHRFRATGDDLTKIAGQMFTEACEALASTKGEIDEQSLHSAVTMIEQADTVWCLGMGTSETAARHCSIVLSRTGVRTRCSGSSGFALANELIDLRPKDVIVMFHAVRDVAELKLVADQVAVTGCKVILVCGVQLREIYRGKVSAILPCVGVPSRLASWSLSAMVLADIIAYSVAVRNKDQALGTKKRLAVLRERAGGAG